MQTNLRSLVLLAGALGLACEAADAGRAAISQGELVERLGSGDAPLVIDVRTRDEFAAGHIPGAMNVPLTELESRLPELELAPGAELVVHCERGGRAERALLILEEAGFDAARPLEGDMRAWRDGGLPCQGC